MSSKTKSGLGKGLESLIPTNFDQSLLLDKSERVQNLFTSQLSPNPQQPRKHFDQQGIEELAVSIKRHGVLQPLIVTPGAVDNEYVIVAGERRWRASQVAGLKSVPAIVRNRDELDQLEVALVENVQRVDLSPLEQAISIEHLHQQFNLSYQEIAKRLGKAETTVSNTVRLLGLPDEARQALINKDITEGHARSILALKDLPSKQQELLHNIVTQGWSVRRAEQFVAAVKQGKASKQSTSRSTRQETADTKALAKRLGVPVKLYHKAKGGFVEIYFDDDEQLKRIVKELNR